MSGFHVHRFHFAEAAPANLVWAHQSQPIGSVQVRVDRCRCGKERVQPIESTMRWYPRADSGV